MSIQQPSPKCQQNKGDNCGLEEETTKKHTTASELMALRWRECLGQVQVSWGLEQDRTRANGTR